MHYYRSKLLIFLSFTFILMPCISIGQTLPTENFEMPNTPTGRSADAYYKAFNSSENIGVIPHIKVAASKALEAAIKNVKKQQDIT